jgi:hypothetical protein
MGFHSWQTADTGVSIPADCIHDEARHFSFTMLRPNGKPKLFCHAYDGYAGCFAVEEGKPGVKAISIFNQNTLDNFPAKSLRGASREEVRLIGVNLNYGNILYMENPRFDNLKADSPLAASVGEAKEKGLYIIPFARKADHFLSSHLLDKPAYLFRGDWQQIIPEFGMCPNDLVSSGMVTKTNYPLKYPIKFVQNPDLEWDDVGPSPSCPNQGFFLSDEQIISILESGRQFYGRYEHLRNAQSRQAKDQIER